MRIIATLWLACGLFLSGALHARPTAEEIARLGKDLTPVGAIRAGTADGRIPAWNPYTPNGNQLIEETPWLDNPYADEEPLITITRDNMAEYAELLTEGHRQMLRRYPTYKMHVYPSHRRAALPDPIYAATIKNASTAVLEDGDPDRLKGATLGFPFPIPEVGAHAVWNHRLKWRGNQVVRYNNQAIVQQSGHYQLTKLVEEVEFLYANLDEPGSMNDPRDVFLYYLSETISPPRYAGQLLLARERAIYRDAWIYNPGLRRVRRAPNVAYDSPYEGTDGQQFYDQVDMINGKLDRFTWKLVGRKPMIIPYNAFDMNSNAIKYDDVIQQFHANQDLIRYEIHRVWIIEAGPREGKRHTMKRKRLYIDEDTWTTAVIDNYDHRNQYYKMQEGHIICLHTMKACSTVPEIIYDLQSGMYFITSMFNEDTPHDFSVRFRPRHFTSAGLKKRRVR